MPDHLPAQPGTGTVIKGNFPCDVRLTESSRSQPHQVAQVVAIRTAQDHVFIDNDAGAYTAHHDSLNLPDLRKRFRKTAANIHFY